MQEIYNIRYKVQNSSVNCHCLITKRYRICQKMYLPTLRYFCIKYATLFLIHIFINCQPKRRNTNIGRRFLFKLLLFVSVIFCGIQHYIALDFFLVVSIVDPCHRCQMPDATDYLVRGTTNPKEKIRLTVKLFSCKIPT